jgi:hypothetical protein
LRVCFAAIATVQSIIDSRVKRGFELAITDEYARHHSGMALLDILWRSL